MKSDTTNEVNEKQLSPKKEIDLLELAKIIRVSRKLIIKVCGIGSIIGIVIGFGIPKEYTANTLIAPESTRRSSSSDMNTLADMAGMNFSITTTGREAIYPSLYPIVVNSTPFLIRLFDVEVHEQKDSIVMPLSRYLKERQKAPWWRIITSSPFRLINWATSLFREKPKEAKAKSKIDLFRLTREEASIAGAIASKIKVGVDKKKRTITIFVTMQDPLVAATVADTVGVCLKEYITEYRTSKARRILEYTEKLRKETQVKYYETQEKYTRYADANQGLVKLTSRTELARLRSEMNLAFSAYNQMEIQVQAAKARVEKVTPVYAVIQPVLIPLTPSKPRKTLILAGCILLSGAGSMIWVLFAKDFVRNIKRKESPVGKLK